MTKEEIVTCLMWDIQCEWWEEVHMQYKYYSGQSECC